MTGNERSRSRRVFVAATLAAILCAASVSALAFGGHRHGRRGGGPEQMIERVLEEVGASEEQREQIGAILAEARGDESREARREQHRALQEQVLTILSAETVDREALDALRTRHQQEMNEHMARMSDALVRAANVLTPEQRVAAADAMREHFERRGHGGRGRHCEGRDGDDGPEAADDRG